MYAYYALRAMRYSPPKSISMVITSLQLTQMIVGCAINIWAFQYLAQGQKECGISRVNIKFSLTMYFSYFVLFARFFYHAYISGSRGKMAKKSLYEEHGNGHIGAAEYTNGKLKAN